MSKYRHTKTAHLRLAAAWDAQGEACGCLHGAPAAAYRGPGGLWAESVNGPSCNERNECNECNERQLASNDRPASGVRRGLLLARHRQHVSATQDGSGAAVVVIAAVAMTDRRAVLPGLAGCATRRPSLTAFQRLAHPVQNGIRTGGHLTLAGWPVREGPAPHRHTRQHPAVMDGWWGGW